MSHAEGGFNITVGGVRGRGWRKFAPAFAGEERLWGVGWCSGWRGGAGVEG